MMVTTAVESGIRTCVALAVGLLVAGCAMAPTAPVAFIAEADFVCNRAIVRVVSVDSPVVVRKGETSEPIQIPPGAVAWYCEEDGRFETHGWQPPPGARFVIVARGSAEGSQGYGEISFYR